MDQDQKRPKTIEVSAVFRGHTLLRAAVSQLDVHGRKLDLGEGPGGHPGVNPMWIEILCDELCDYLRAQKSVPKRETCLDWVRTHAQARGWKIGNNVALKRIVRPAFLIVWPENC
jgi:hypothetical protein